MFRISFFRSRATVAALILACSATGAEAQTRGARPPLTLEPFAHRAFDGRETAAELGRITVPERRGAPGGRTVEVAFVRLRTRAARPDPPVVWMAGGPGTPGALMARVPVYFALFERIRARSDVILVDQRGLGMSRPVLDCPAAGAPVDLFASEARWSAVFAERTAACARRWKEAGVDLAGYTSEESADDIDDIRAALGYERVSLLGHSYGTLLGQVYLQRHGGRVHRAVLASVEGPNDRVSQPAVWDVLITRLGYFAARDSALAGAVPDLSALYRRVLERLDRQPVEVAITQRPSNQPVTLRVGGIGLRWVMRMKMADGRTYGSIPALLLALDRGEYQALARELEPLYNGFSRSAMATAVDCAGGWPEGRMMDAGRAAQGALFRNVNLQWESGACAGAGVRTGRGGPPVFTTVPTLFISGTLDTNTPPFQAEEVRWGFPVSVHLVIDNAGHESLPSPAVQDIVARFLAGEDVSAARVSFPAPRFTAALSAPAGGPR
ncbi:MAG TPA: alpha/beta fold hydrolase [Longimicrobium sp.]|jgi:pimeloyl-ACP methyl ester carboxylesterase|uniref:alpha/beta hydrolase n=1 Tax=Longimicrobium sp. TaxID=2029185 RepID=UPI002ED84336